MISKRSRLGLCPVNAGLLSALLVGGLFSTIREAAAQTHSCPAFAPTPGKMRLMVIGDLLDAAWGSRTATIQEALKTQWGPPPPSTMGT